MTDNEKASTFIGWREGQKCKVTDVACRHFDQPWFDADSEESKRWLKEGGTHPPFADHDVPAPDMADARNWSKALDSEMCELIRDYEGWRCHLARLRGTASEGVPWHPTAGAAIIAALAQLYDHLH